MCNKTDETTVTVVDELNQPRANDNLLINDETNTTVEDDLSELPALPSSNIKEKVSLQYAATFAATMSLFLTGLLWGWSGPALIEIKATSLPLNLSDSQLSWIASLASCAAIPGPVLGAVTVNLIGRKLTILLLAIPYLSGWILLYFSKFGVIYMYLSRVLGGLAIGTSLTIVPMYIGEISSPNIRGILTNVMTLQIYCGVLIMYSVQSFVSVRTGSCIFAIFPVLFFILFAFMPESPYYYIMKGQENKAANVIKLLRGPHFNVNREINRMKNAINERAQNKNSIIKLLDKQNRFPLIITLGIFTSQQLSGITAFSVYAPIILNSLHSPIPPFFGILSIAILSVISIFISGFLVDVFGRKVLLLLSTLCTTFPLLIIASYFCIKEYYNINVADYTLIPTLALISYPLTYGIGLGPIPYIYIGELFATDVKTLASFIVSVFSSTLAFIIVKSYQPIVDLYGVHAMFFFFTLSCLLSCLFTLNFVPETKCKTLEQIQKDFQENQ